MAFVNEYISEEDKKKHNFSEGNHFYVSPPTSWTVDHERDMFLVMRWINGREPWVDPGITKWAFYWKGSLLDIEIFCVAIGGDDFDEHGWEHLRINSIRNLPPEYETHCSALLADLKEAFTAQKGLGVDSPYQTYTVTLDTK